MSVMSMKNESSVVDVVPNETSGVNGMTGNVLKMNVPMLMDDLDKRECDDGMRSIVVDNECTRTLVGDLRRLSGIESRPLRSGLVV